jgi:hypothetical protein
MRRIASSGASVRSWASRRTAPTRLSSSAQPWRARTMGSVGHGRSPVLARWTVLALAWCSPHPRGPPAYAVPSFRFRSRLGAAALDRGDVAGCGQHRGGPLRWKGFEANCGRLDVPRRPRRHAGEHHWPSSPLPAWGCDCRSGARQGADRRSCDGLFMSHLTSLTNR